MDKLVQEKQAIMEAVPITIIPIVSTSAPASAIPTAHPTDEASKLIKAMEDISIQTTKINKLKEQVKSLEYGKTLVEAMHQAKVQKAIRLTKKVHKLEKELSLTEPLAQEKQELWANIINSVNDIWPSIYYI